MSLKDQIKQYISEVDDISYEGFLLWGFFNKLWTNDRTDSVGRKQHHCKLMDIKYMPNYSSYKRYAKELQK